ncbi:DUF7344 domain-containing protein [Halorussus halophilus]|uniref:DUF7344 domain-containing protein n=1 Tax=Halorussus halophilus TaxID=2650975 RepID=UPI001300E59A|nr:hypothetical protein [Halorussus halophilus]
MSIEKLHRDEGEREESTREQKRQQSGNGSVAEKLGRESRVEDGTADSRNVARETVFEMLSNRRRRHVVHYLLRESGTVELRTLSRNVAAWENDKQVERVTSEERRRVYNALQQSHLPKMADAGVVQYDAARSTVAAAEDLDELQIYLEVVPGKEIPWSHYYLLLGVFCGSLTLAAGAGVPPFASVSGVPVAGIVAALFLVSAAAHVYVNRKMRLGAASRPPNTL